jgi:hypothetical protein
MDKSYLILFSYFYKQYSFTMVFLEQYFYKFD